MPDSSVGTLDLLVREMGLALAPLASRLHEPHHALMLLAEMGLRLPEGSVTPAMLTALQSIHEGAHAVPDLVQTLTAAIAADDVTAIVRDGVALAGHLTRLIDGFGTLADAFQALGSAPGIPPAELNSFVAALPRRLFETIVVAHMEAQHGVPFSLMEFLGLLEKVRQNPGSNDPARPEFVAKALRLDRLGPLLTSPDKLLEDLYGWGQAGFDGARLLARVGSLLQAMRIPVTLRQLPGPSPRPAIEVCIATLAPTVGVVPPGIDIAFAMDIGSGTSVDLPIADGWQAHLASEGALGASVGMRIQPPATVTVIPPAGSVDGRLVLGLARVPMPPATRIALFGITGGTGLSVERIELQLISGFRWDSTSATAIGDFGFGGQVRGGKLKLGMDGADGFIGKVMSGVHVEADFNLDLNWTAGQGITFSGSSALQIQLPTHISLGPVDLDALTVSIGIDGSRFPIELTTNIKAGFGPLTGLIEQMGAAADMSFPSNGRGEVGPMNLAFRFKPPKGVGLSLDAGIVRGGGFLDFDPDKGEYAGALQLSILEVVSVSAVGLISTRMPDGSSGFSLLIIITADFGPGIQLGFGFTLLAVGGLLGLNRGVLMQPLLEGVKSNAVASVMFPRDVIANAPRIISDLKAFFPPLANTFLIGPMAKLGWGEPTLVSLSLGVIVEIPPGNVAILGILRAALPAEDAAILVLQVNFIGVFEPNKQRLYFFASLFDSHLLFITIDGQMGVLFAYGADANFVLSIGGFHPQFKPPPLPFPTPARIQIDIINESFARIHCDGYFAVTTNTVQFGTHSSYYFGFSALSVEGHSGFDALIQFSPFHFVAEISTAFSVKVFGLGVYGVDIDLSLEGPTPWHAHGTASISFLFFSIGIGIDFTWGDARDTSLPPVAVMPLLGTELGKRSNWRALPPTQSNLLVSLRKFDTGKTADTDLVLHPVGTLQISQRAVPLDITLDKIGSQKPSDATRFSLSAGAGPLRKTRDLQEQFASGQFKDYADADRLSAAAYSPSDGGIELSAPGTVYASGTAMTRIVRYDLTIIDKKLLRLVLRFFIFAHGLFQHLLLGSSVARSSLSAYQKSLSRPDLGKVVLANETFAVAFAANNQVYHADAAHFTSVAAANDFVARTVTTAPSLSGSLHVLPSFELAA